MPRLVLSLPTELGPGRTPRSDGAFRTDSAADCRSLDRPHPDDGLDDQPRIEQWLSCWTDGADRR
ncbi:hypothetical protein [Halorhabdus rudnickae]|uniref:hypothetical protein n=1 Tax=Halorhabdus rudnickae TaxID=1775544 RepID=UPI0010825801|nr:hypothetical protein [Halorhabdus rudnickae]